MNKRILLDVTELATFDKGTGIQRVTRAILQELKERPPADCEVVAVKGDATLEKFIRVDDLDAQARNAGEANQNGAVIDMRKEDVYLSLDLTYNISSGLNQELVHARSRGVKTYFVIYDLIPLMYPEWFLGNNDWFEGNNYLDLFNHWFDCAAQSDGLICISRAVQDDVSKWLDKHNIAKPAIGFFHLGADFSTSLTLSNISEGAAKKLQLLRSRVTFLMVGTIEPRKGHQLALEAVEKLWDDGLDINLVFVGKQGWNVDQLVNQVEKHSELNEKLFWFSDAGDELLGEIYQSSSSLLALSQAEGFGLPLIEAAHYQLPIIARDIPVFREICKESALYFGGVDNIDLYTTLKEWLSLYAKNSYPKPDDIQILSWDESAAQLINVVEKLSGVSL